MKFALCNEIFRNLSLEDAFQKIADIGYQGVEVAPFTLQPNPRDLSESDADRCRTAAEKAGLEVVGLHWLMAETEGLHLTHSDPAILKVTQEYLIKLGKLTARMNGSILVLGSPQQRNLLPDTTYEQAFEQAVKLMKAVCRKLKTSGLLLRLNRSPKWKPTFYPPVRGQRFCAGGGSSRLWTASRCQSNDRRAKWCLPGDSRVS